MIRFNQIGANGDGGGGRIVVNLAALMGIGADGTLTLNHHVLQEVVDRLIAQHAFETAGETERTRRVEILRAENEKSSDARFSRLCRGCRSADPRERVVLTHCGHAVCRQCSDADGRYSLIVCPVCEKYSVFLRLFEERTSGQKEETSDASPASFSRVCGVCYTPNPAVRAVVKTCGHVACLACMEQLKRADRVKCPFCRENSPIVILIEQLLNEEGVECGVWVIPANAQAAPDEPPTDSGDRINHDYSTITRYPGDLEVEVPAQSTHYDNSLAMETAIPEDNPDMVATPIVAQKTSPEDIPVIVAQPVAEPENSLEPVEEVHQERADGGRQSIFCCFSRRFRGICG